MRAEVQVTSGGSAQVDVTDDGGRQEDEAVDPTVLESLTQRLGDRGPAFRQSLVQTWRDETTHRLADLDEAVTTGSVDGAARVAHTLRSSSAALGAMRLSRLCGDLEDGLRRGDQRDLAAEAAALRAGVAEADSAFTRLWG